MINVVLLLFPVMGLALELKGYLPADSLSFHSLMMLRKNGCYQLLSSIQPMFCALFPFQSFSDILDYESPFSLLIKDDNNYILQVLYRSLYPKSDVPNG